MKSSHKPPRDTATLFRSVEIKKPDNLSFRIDYQAFLPCCISALRLRFHKLHIHLDFHFVGHHGAAGFGEGVPAQAKFFAFERARHFKGCFKVAVRVFHGAVVLDLERHRLGHVADAQVAVELVLLAAEAFHTCGLEGHQREFFAVEKVVAAQVVVAGFHAGVHRAGFDAEFDVGGAEIIAFGADIGGKFVEFARHSRDNEVPDAESDFGVGRVELPVGRCHIDLHFFQR